MHAVLARVNIASITCCAEGRNLHDMLLRSEAHNIMQ